MLRYSKILLVLILIGFVAGYGCRKKEVKFTPPIADSMMKEAAIKHYYTMKLEQMPGEYDCTGDNVIYKYQISGVNFDTAYTLNCIVKIDKSLLVSAFRYNYFKDSIDIEFHVNTSPSSTTYSSGSHYTTSTFVNDVTNNVYVYAFDTHNNLASYFYRLYYYYLEDSISLSYSYSNPGESYKTEVSGKRKRKK